MLSVRAGVRAHVSAHSGDDGDRRGLCRGRHRPPVAAAAGAGGGGRAARARASRTFARAVAPHLGASPGAVVLRTDEVRKRLLGMRADAAPARATPTRRSPTARTYDALFDDARGAAEAGRAVVLDASFLDPALRARAEAAGGADCGVPFHGVWLDAPAAGAGGPRGRPRRGDASDATVAVLREPARPSRCGADRPGSTVDAAGEVAARRGRTPGRDARCEIRPRSLSLARDLQTIIWEARMLGLMQDWPLTVDKILDHARPWHGDREVVSRSVEGPIVRTTYAEIHERAKRLSQRAAGAGRADRATGSRPWPGTPAGTWRPGTAIMGIGAVCHTLNPRLFTEQLCYIINHAEDRIIFADLTFVPLLAAEPRPDADASSTSWS